MQERFHLETGRQTRKPETEPGTVTGRSRAKASYRPGFNRNQSTSRVDTQRLSHARADQREGGMMDAETYRHVERYTGFTYKFGSIADRLLYLMPTKLILFDPSLKDEALRILNSLRPLKCPD